MDKEKRKKEIQEAIKMELKKLNDFSDFVKEYPLGKEVEEKIINERLDEIIKLKAQLKNL